MALETGEVFAGYTVRRLLGSGGMGEVYLVEHPRLPRLDALKVLREHASAGEEFRVRFNREAELAASLWHPYIVGVHDRGEFEGRLWISMDYVEGTDAAHLLKDRHPNGMPLGDVVSIVASVASALDYAHHRGLLHRDIKPANILLAEGIGSHRRILLSDFGIAREMGDVSELTATNHAIGTVSYSAPEQLMGDQVDGRADQYSLAATAFRLLTGGSPFRETNPVAVISQHLHAPPPRASARRAELAPVDEVLMRAMAKDPEDRFATCIEFAEAFAQRAAAVGGSPSPAATSAPAASPPSPPHSAGERTMPWTPVPAAAPLPIPPHGGPGPTSRWVSNQMAFAPPAARRSKRWLAAAAIAAAVVLVATGVIIAVNVGGGDDAANPVAKSARTTTTTTSTPTLSPPSLVGVPGNYESLQSYIQKNHLQQQAQHRGDTSAPTVMLPIPQGWRDAREESPNFAYQTLVYDGPDAVGSRPFLVVILSKVTGNVDAAAMFSLASGELYNLPGWVPDDPGTVGKLDGYPQYQLSGRWNAEDKVMSIVQKTVLLNWTEGFYVLQINMYAVPEYRPIIDRMIAAIDKDAVIYPP